MHLNNTNSSIQLIAIKGLENIFYVQNMILQVFSRSFIAFHHIFKIYYYDLLPE